MRRIRWQLQRTDPPSDCGTPLKPSVCLSAAHSGARSSGRTWALRAVWPPGTPAHSPQNTHAHTKRHTHTTLTPPQHLPRLSQMERGTGSPVEEQPRFSLCWRNLLQPSRAVSDRDSEENRNSMLGWELSRGESLLPCPAPSAWTTWRHAACCGARRGGRAAADGHQPGGAPGESGKLRF